jgi:hypothetical protein
MRGTDICRGYILAVLWSITSVRKIRSLEIDISVFIDSRCCLYKVQRTTHILRPYDLQATANGHDQPVARSLRFLAVEQSLVAR